MTEPDGKSKIAARGLYYAKMYGPLAILVFLGLGFGYASVYAVTPLGALGEMRELISAAAQLTPGSWPAALTGGGTLFGFAIFISIAVSYTGDWFVPFLGRLAWGFGMPRTRWLIRHATTWERIQYDFRENYPLEGGSPIGSDPEKWEAYKLKLGRYWIRAFRAMVVIAFAVMVACAVGMIYSPDRWRWSLSTGVCAVGMFIFAGISWADQYKKFASRLANAYRSFVEKEGQEMPAHLQSFLDLIPPVKNVR